MNLESDGFLGIQWLSYILRDLKIRKALLKIRHQNILQVPLDIKKILMKINAEKYY